jgi:hypothetical protein
VRGCPLWDRGVEYGISRGYGGVLRGLAREGATL